MSKRKPFKCKSEAQKKAIRRSYAVRAQSAENKIEMRLARIPNKYMYKGGYAEGSHIYAVYQDETTNEVRAIETTHLYVPDQENMRKLKRGLLYKVKFAGYETPSGVNNYYYNTDVNGNPISLNKAGIDLDKTILPVTQAKKIRDFAKNPRKRD